MSHARRQKRLNKRYSVKKTFEELKILQKTVRTLNAYFNGMPNELKLLKKGSSKKESLIKLYNELIVAENKIRDIVRYRTRVLGIKRPLEYGSYKQPSV